MKLYLDETATKWPACVTVCVCVCRCKLFTLKRSIRNIHAAHRQKQICVSSLTNDKKKEHIYKLLQFLLYSPQMYSINFASLHILVYFHYTLAMDVFAFGVRLQVSVVMRRVLRLNGKFHV